jgi:hypothetical protein
MVIMTRREGLCMACSFSTLPHHSSFLIHVHNLGAPGYVLGFPFYVQKFFTRNIVTDVTDGYYVVITVVTT